MISILLSLCRIDALHGRGISYSSLAHSRACLLFATQAHAYGSQNRTVLVFDPVAAAIASHDGSNPGAVRAAAPKQQLAGMSLSNPRTQNLSEHPWDDEPEGMPTANGQIISAAQMFAEAGEPLPQLQLQTATLSPAAPLRTRTQAIAEANRRMAGGGTMDPEVGLDLDEAFASHDKIDTNPVRCRSRGCVAVLFVGCLGRRHAPLAAAPHRDPAPSSENSSHFPVSLTYNIHTSVSAGGDEGAGLCSCAGEAVAAADGGGSASGFFVCVYVCVCVCVCVFLLSIVFSIFFLLALSILR